MKYRQLGLTDIKVSVICLGTMTWGEQNTSEEAFEQMDYSVDQGINFFDTAEIYAVPPKEETYGLTEKIIGNWFNKSKKRDKIFLASKIASRSDDITWIRKGKNRQMVDGQVNNFCPSRCKSSSLNQITPNILSGQRSDIWN